MDEKKDEDMDVAEDLYVANDLYEEDDFETGINRGASPTRDGAPSPPRVQAMEVDSGTRTLRTSSATRVVCSLGSHAPSREPFAVAMSEPTWSPAGLC